MSNDCAAPETGRAWAKAWLGAPVIGVANGALREKALRGLGERRAHQVSTLTLLIFLTLYVREVDARRPLPSRDAALRMGALWSGLTVGFEFLFGLLVTRDRLSDLLKAYKGPWALVPLWLSICPEVVRRGRTCKKEENP